jgi:hypothetical protein
LPHSITVRNPLPVGVAGVNIPSPEGFGIPAVAGQTIVLDDVSFSRIPNYLFGVGNSFGVSVLIDNGMINPAVPTPTLTGVNPATAPHGTGTALTLTGTFFTGATQVLFNGVAGTALTVTNSTAIAVTSPVVAAAGPCVVQVVTPGGTATLTTGFSFT